MIICPWCGTHYLTFQPNCKNCGGPMQMTDEETQSSTPAEKLAKPPPPPRPISKNYIWRLLYTDGWSIVAFVFGLIGLIFTPVGAGLTLGIATALVGLPFLLLGAAFLGTGVWVFIWRYKEMQGVVNVLRVGETTLGKIIEVRENYSVTINGRHPWIIQYQFQADGQGQEGTVTTLHPPGKHLLAGKAVYVLYLPMAPKWSSIYPHP
jgi:hypothetical protein